MVRVVSVSGLGLDHYSADRAVDGWAYDPNDPEVRHARIVREQERIQRELAAKKEKSKKNKTGKKRLMRLKSPQESTEVKPMILGVVMKETEL